MATGSGDATVKVLDVDTMMSKTAIGHQQETHPVIRTLFDHTNVSIHQNLLQQAFSGNKIEIKNLILTLLVYIWFYYVCFSRQC